MTAVTTVTASPAAHPADSTGSEKAVTRAGTAADHGAGSGSAGVTALIAMAARASGQAAVVAVTLVATRVLGPADFGVFAIGAALLTLARTMLYTGPFEYLLKAPLDRTGPVAAACLAANLAVALGWIVLLALIGAVSPVLFRGPGVGAILFALCPSNLVAALAGWLESLMLRSGRVRRYYGVTIGVEVLSAGGAVALLLAGCGLWALVAQVYIRLLLLVAFYSLQMPRVRLARFDPAETLAVLRWSVSRYGSVVVGFLSNYSGDLMLGMVFSPAASGLYRVANRIVTALADMFNQPAGLLMTTSLAAARARGERGGGTWPGLLLPFAAIAWPALAVLAILADAVAPVVLGPAWAAAGPVIMVFCLARMAALIGTGATAALIVGDRQGRLLAIQSTAALAGGGLTLLVVHWGALAAASVAAVVAVAAAAALVWSALAEADEPDRGASRPAALVALFWQALVPLAGSVAAAVAARLVLGATAQGLASVPHLALALTLAIAGWGLALLPVLPALRQSLIVLAGQLRAA